MEKNQSERFLMTLREIIDQLKLNSNVIDIQSILDFIDLILKINRDKKMVFVYVKLTIGPSMKD